jgi:hypothetical protein
VSDTAQNVINTLQERRHRLMIEVMQLGAIAKRCAFEACVNDSWKAKQGFCDAEQEGDRLTNEIAMLDLALSEALGVR